MATWEVLAVRFGSRITTRSDYYMRFQTYDEPDGPLPMDYFFWAVRSPEETILVDTGWDPARGRQARADGPPRAASRHGAARNPAGHGLPPGADAPALGPRRQLSAFPDAEILVQERELEFWGSPMGKRLQFAVHAEADDIDYVLRADREGRVQRLRGR